MAVSFLPDICSLDENTDVFGWFRSEYSLVIDGKVRYDIFHLLESIENNVITLKTGHYLKPDESGYVNLRFILATLIVDFDSSAASNKSRFGIDAVATGDYPYTTFEILGIERLPY